jgi:hypothetical protein
MPTRFRARRAFSSDAWARRRERVFVRANSVAGAFAYPTHDPNRPEHALISKKKRMNLQIFAIMLRASLVHHLRNPKRT